MSAAPQLAREYELIYILRPTVGPQEARKVSERLTDVIEKGGAKLTRVDNWGKRKLAYAIQKHTRGVFVYVTFAAPTGLVTEVERNLRILDPVLRYQTVRLDAEYDLSELTVDPDDVEFVEIEATEDEDDDPTFEEQLGMRPPPPPREAKAEGDEAKAEGDEAKAEGAEAKAEGAEAKAEGAEAKAEGDEAKAEGAEAKAEGAEGETEETTEAEASDDAKKEE